MRLSRFIRIGALAVFAAGMAMPAAAQPVRYELQEFEIDIEPVSREIERILARSTEPCGRLQEVSSEIDRYLSFVDPSLEDEARIAIDDRFGKRITALRRTCFNNAQDFTLGGLDLGELGVASDSTTFCTFRPGNPEIVKVFSVPRPAPPGPPECPDGSEDCATEPESDGIELPPTVLPPEDFPPGELPDPLAAPPQPEDPCERLQDLTDRFLELSGSLFVTGNKRDDIERARSEEAVSILPQILLLRQRCPGPCEELRRRREERAEFDEFLELVAQARKAGVPLEEKRVAINRARAFALQEEIDRLEKLCPDLNPFLEQIELLLFDDEVESEESCIEGTCPPTPDCGPDGLCADPVSEDGPSAPEEDPLPVSVPFNVPVKATSTALDSGQRAEQIAGQVVVLLTPDQINPALPEPGGERPQLGHDADRASGVTGQDGRVDIAIDLTEFVQEASADKLSDGGPGGFFEITVDTTARDGFIVMLPPGDSLRARVTPLGLDRLLVSDGVIEAGIEADGGDSDTMQFGVFNGPSEQVDLARRILSVAIPGVRIEDDLCMIKEPAAVTDYNGCDFGEAGPPPGVRVLRPPAPHAELPGGALDPALTKEGETP